MSRNYHVKESEQGVLNKAFDNEYNTLVTTSGEFDGASVKRPTSRNVAKKITESGDYTYIAIAPIGTAQSEAKWQVKRIQVSGNDTIFTWADGDDSFDNIATDLTALSYS